MIGGVGGSGTRVYHTICRLAGYHMGWWSTSPSSGDCLPLTRWFFPRWIDPYLRGRLDRAGLLRMRREFGFWMRLSYPFRRAKWGWKNPRTLYLLPFLNELFPSMVYVHVVRDGRDQAFSHFPYRSHEACMLTEEESRLDDPVRKALHWSRLNRMGEAYAQEHMRDRYLVSRLEDLCSAPREEVQRIFGFLQVEGGPLEAAVREVRTPSSLGRWRREPFEVLRPVEQAIGRDLGHYGYELAS